MSNAATAGDTTIQPVRWCPAQIGSLGPGDQSGATGLQSSYFINPHWTYTSYTYPNTTPNYVSQGGVPTTALYTKLSQYRPFDALGCEEVTSGVSVAHPGPSGSSYYNLLFRDGHVVSVLDSSGFVLATIGRGGGVSHVFQRFDDYIDLMETLAEGLNGVGGKYGTTCVYPGYMAADPGLGIDGIALYREDLNGNPTTCVPFHVPGTAPGQPEYAYWP